MSDPTEIIARWLSSDENDVWPEFVADAESLIAVLANAGIVLSAMPDLAPRRILDHPVKPGDDGEGARD